MTLHSVSSAGSLAVAILLAAKALGEEQVLWNRNRITPDQPFPAKVCAVANVWPGYELLLEEIGGKRLCHAQIWHSMLPKYSILNATGDPKRDAPNVASIWTFLSPSIEIDQFNWSMGVFQIGRRFQDDLVMQSLQNLALGRAMSVLRGSRSLLAPWILAVRF